ncbi:MAG TPA: hypothetical protein VG965_04490 [Patescibacteria group bacterium]|nr:hypothetical protein [Patescibacteria group bacterium]
MAEDGVIERVDEGFNIAEGVTDQLGCFPILLFLFLSVINLVLLAMHIIHIA